jgi:hypothetical protein
MVFRKRKSDYDGKRSFDKEQYNRLVSCSFDNDISNWNDWYDKEERKLDFEPPTILLEGADLSNKFLSKSRLLNANLRGANFSNANLFGADLSNANLQEANFDYADLRGANLNKAHLEGAKISNTYLNGAAFEYCYVNGETTIVDCAINEFTNFTGVGLDTAIVEPRIKVALRDNIRRNQWIEWSMEGNKFTKIFKICCILPFWYLTDFGRTTWKIVLWFLIFSLCFGFIYFAFETKLIPGTSGIIHELGSVGEGQSKILFSKGHILARALYFSIVTMTTLGFGDMHAAKTGDIWALIGYLLLSVQVIIGYVLLGALITRLAIIFTGEGPFIDRRKLDHPVYSDNLKIPLEEKYTKEIEDLKREIEELKGP